jgi:hypothetical protein
MTVESDNEKLKQFVTYLMNTFKALESELSAFRMALYALKTTYTEVEAGQAGRFFETSLALAKLTPKLQQAMHDKYDVALEQFLAGLSAQSALDLEQVSQWLQGWKPTGPVN